MGILNSLFGQKGAAQARQLLQEMDRIASGGPSAAAMQRLSEIMYRFTQTVQDSRAPAITEVLLNGINSPNPGVRGLSIQSLGLVYDQRALPALMQCYPKLAGDHRQRAVAAIVNLVNNRDKNPVCITTLKEIAKDGSLATEVRAHGVMALCNFRRTDASVETFLSEMGRDPNEAEAVRVATL